MPKAQNKVRHSFAETLQAKEDSFAQAIQAKAWIGRGAIGDGNCRILRALTEYVSLAEAQRSQRGPRPDTFCHEYAQQLRQNWFQAPKGHPIQRVRPKGARDVWSGNLIWASRSGIKVGHRREPSLLS